MFQAMRRRASVPAVSASPAGRFMPRQAGYATRRDWPDGTHEFVGFRRMWARAEQFARGDADY